MKLSPWMRRLAIAAHMALIVGLLAREGATKIGWVLLVLLLLPLPGIVRGHAYTYAWASMLVTFYTGGYLTAVYAHAGDRTSAVVLACLAAADFCGLVLYVRFRAREGVPGPGARRAA